MSFLAVRFVLCAFLLVLLNSSPAHAQSFSSAIRFGSVDAFEIDEASGLIASRQNPGVLWTHNDSASTLYAISTNGLLLGTYWFPDVFSGDFEDIAIGPGPKPEYQYLYLGDLGDNDLVRESVRVLRLPEPAVSTNSAAAPWSRSVIDSAEIILRYPDQPYNAEALFIDPLTGDLFIPTKLTNSCRLYRATRAELESGTNVTLSFIREISFFKVSGGDIAPDGRLILLRRGGTVASWSRSLTQTVGDALAASGRNAPVADEPNGEAIAFQATGLGYFTLSEGFGQTNYYYRRTDTASLPKQPAVYIAPGSAWRYSDLGADLGSAWRASNYDDRAWPEGRAQLGYGQGDELTTLSYGIDDFDKIPTTYFRRAFTINTTNGVTNLALRVCFNDGAAVYLNGQEVWRRHLAPNAAYADFAAATGSERQNLWQSVAVSPALLRIGTNVVAAEIHRYLNWEPDLTFDLQLTEGFVEPPVKFVAAPELVGGRWRVRLSGPAGSLAAIESSADLQSWSPAGRTVLTNGLGTFVDPSAATNRFYRIRR